MALYYMCQLRNLLYEECFDALQSWADAALSVFYSITVDAGTDGGDVP